MGATGYHCTAKSVSFGKGQSAVHTAAYNAREQLFQEREGRATKDYNKGDHSEVLFTGIFAPKDAPEWAHDRQQLWNRAEAAEKRKDGQPARNITVAFPHQLDQQQREWLLKDFAREEFARKGMVADASMHAPDKHGDQRNFHAHILATMRKIEGQEFAQNKWREWNSKEQLNTWRASWAERGANALTRAGYAVEAERWRHGHKTLAEQRAAALARGDKEFAAQLEGEATIHKGAKAAAMERRGAQSDRLDRLQQIVERNDIRVEIKKLEAEATKERAAGATRAESRPSTPNDFLTELWNGTRTGRAFQDGLEARAWILARGDWGNFAAIDRKGGVHNLSTRIDGVSREAVAARFADVKPESLYSIPEAKEVQAGRAVTREKDAQARRDAAAAARFKAATTPTKDKVGGATQPRESGLVAKPAAKAGGFLSALGGALFRAFTGENAAPSREASGEQEKPHPREEADRAKRMQEILREVSQEIPPERQRDHEAEKDRKAREERDKGGRTRGE